MKRSAVVAAIVGAAALIYWGAALRREAATTAPPRHVLLITIDTLRADRLGSYGYGSARTPTLDALSRRGARFARAYATAPITLTSHASMMTGRYPPAHGARHNGMAVQADVPLLAEHLKHGGFQTAAFVSAFPLDKRFGLARGFDVYDDELPRGESGRRANERSGASTVDHAIRWLREHPAGARLFAWVHLFEPHAPYGAPGGGRSASDRYDDEIATADREIGRLLAAWPRAEESLVIAVADHGEAFGEHGEIGHSIFVYDATLHVPLIMAGPGIPHGVGVNRPVTVADLAPTIAAATGVPPIASDGIDLQPLLDGVAAADRGLYAESFAPLVDFGWSSLRSIRHDEMKLIVAPRPELYDLAADPDETTNVLAHRAARAGELRGRVDRISGPDLPAGGRPLDPDALARLRALGYASRGSTPPADRADPKDRIAIASRLAGVTSGELQGAAAEAALREVLQLDAGNPQAQQRLGFVLAESGRCREAEGHFAAAIATGLPSADPYLGLAMCQARRGAAAASMATLARARRAEPGNPVVEANIGLLTLDLGRLEEAAAALSRAVEIDPDLHQARFALARALARGGEREAARRQAAELLRRLPPTAPQRPEVERLLVALGGQTGVRPGSE